MICKMPRLIANNSVKGNGMQALLMAKQCE